MSPTMFEVEAKFHVADAEGLIQRVRRLGGEFGPPRLQVDTYFSHPQRDFGKTDEALRIRSGDDAVAITYKGPRIDESTKTRQELEIPLSSAEQHARLLELLGFRPSGVVRKRRRSAKLVWQERDFEVCLDDVEQLGEFVELETIAGAEELDAARTRLASLAADLGLAGGERRSYLELLTGS